MRCVEKGHCFTSSVRAVASNFRNSTPRGRIPYTEFNISYGKSAMRRTILSAILVLLSTLGFAQSTSPEALYERGMDAITGVGSSRNDSLGVDYFRRSADLGYGPAQIALGYYYETGSGRATGPGHRPVSQVRATGRPTCGLAGRTTLLPRQRGGAMRRSPKMAQDRRRPEQRLRRLLHGASNGGSGLHKGPEAL